MNVPSPTTAKPCPFLVPTLLISLVKVVSAAGKMPWNPATKKPIEWSQFYVTHKQPAIVLTVSYSPAIQTSFAIDERPEIQDDSRDEAGRDKDVVWSSILVGKVRRNQAAEHTDTVQH